MVLGEIRADVALLDGVKVIWCTVILVLVSLEDKSYEIEYPEIQSIWITRIRKKERERG